MQKYLLSRLIQSILILLGVLVLVFIMVRITGDPVALMVPREATAEAREIFRHKMGFDRPQIVQFVDFMRGALLGDFGDSLHFKDPALPMVLHRLPATLQLATAAMIMAIAVAVPLGLVGGARPGSIWDTIGRIVGLLGQSIPGFWLALIMIFFFAVRLGWFPSFGRDTLKSMVMPAFLLGLGTMGALTRLTRSAVLENRGEDYFRTAYIKGLNTRKI